MNIPQRTRPLRAAEAIAGRRRATDRAEFVRVMASQLDQIAPGTVRVVVAPLVVEDTPRTWVELIGAAGQVTSSSAEQCRAAFGLLSRAFPAADWSRPREYDARAGVLAVHTRPAPAALGLDTAEVAR
ncbi:hypothetical protein [Streptomyces similanensis]|uniref:hypothetical protein n=1 Tax=Streptomyces similanensis TaxID=1274988 RepID=UPI0031EEA7B6